MKKPPSVATFVARKPRSVQDAELRQLLAARDLRVTEQRMVILRELAKIENPISHPELTERLTDATLDRATVYRNLLSLTKAGLLVRIQLGDNVWRFELPRASAATHGTHPHFVCSTCGDVACLPHSAVTLRGDAIRNQVVEVQLRGRCVNCSKGTQL